MKLLVRFIAIAALSSCVTWFAFSRLGQDRSSADSPAPGEHPTKAERPRPRSQAAAAIVAQNSTDSERMEFASRVLAEESQQVRDAFQQLFISDPANAELLRLSMNRWFDENPELARKLAFLLLEGSSISACLPEVKKNWLPRDLDYAFAWIHGLPPGDLQSSWINQLGRFYTEVDPLRALTLLRASNSPARQEEFVIQVMDRWAEFDFRKAGQHLVSMPAGPIRNAAERAYLCQITEHMPAVAAAYVASEMSPDSSAQEEATRLVVSRWAHLDPVAAARWLETFPASALRAEMIGVLIPTWAEKDPAAASAWSSTLSVSARD